MSSDLELQWARLDRMAWVEYRKWEDWHFLLDPARPLKDPKGMAEARQAFEKQQKIEKTRYFQKESRQGLIPPTYTRKESPHAYTTHTR